MRTAPRIVFVSKSFIHHPITYSDILSVKIDNYLQIYMCRRSQIPYRYFRNGFELLAKIVMRRLGWLVIVVNWKLERAASWKVTDERIQTWSIDRQWKTSSHSSKHCTAHFISLVWSWWRATAEWSVHPWQQVYPSFAEYVHENLARILWLLFTAKLVQFLQKMTVSKHVDGQPSALLTREENQANNVKISHSNWWWHILSSLLKSSKQFSFRMYWPYWLDWKSVISSLSLLLPGGAGTSGEQMSNSCHHSCTGFHIICSIYS